MAHAFRKLQANQLDALLSDLHDFSVGVPAQVQGGIIPQIDMARSVLNNEPRQVREVAESIGNWLLEYFQCVVSSQPQSKLMCHTPVSDIALSPLASCPCGIYVIPVLLPSLPRYD